MSDTLKDLFGDVIYTYTRKQAIEDGVLIDVSETAKEAGLKIPVAITKSLFNIVNTVSKRSCQSFDGRLWDVLYMGAFAAKGNPTQSTILYKLRLTHGRKKNITLKMVIGGGDNGEPVITIMLPDED